MSNLPFLNFWNHSRQLLSLKAASPYVSTSNRRASARFFRIEKVNQKFPQMSLIRLKTRHFRRQKNILYWWNSLIFQGYVADRYPTLRQWRFISVDFNPNLLVMPAFVKRRKLICTPDTSCGIAVNSPGRNRTKWRIENCPSTVFIWNLDIIVFVCSNSGLSGH